MAARWCVSILVVLALAGFALTLWIFYPGIMTYDAGYVRDEMVSGQHGDWQSPVMAVLWRVVDPIAPGSASLFLVDAALYWGGFLLAALALARSSWPLAVVVLLLALLPPAFVFVGIIWRDVLMAVLWLFAASLSLVTVGNATPLRRTAQAIAVLAVLLGFLLRPNALFAAPVLIAYIASPQCFSWRRAAVIYLPAVAGLYGLMQIVYYDVLSAVHKHPVQSIMVFDLGGISHFSGDNQFPGAWTEAETQAIVESCYRPTEWDIYWWRLPCRFVMARLEADGVFGTPALAASWFDAVRDHPLAYLEHRFAFMANFLFGSNLTLWTEDFHDHARLVFGDRPSFLALKWVHDALKPTPLFRAGTWLILDAVIVVLAWRRRGGPLGAFAVVVALAAVLYVATFLAVGVASDFRYAYWAVLAAIVGGVATRSAATPSRSGNLALETSNMLLSPPPTRRRSTPPATSTYEVQ